MKRMMLKSKIHGGRITRTRLDYPGSITIDLNILAAAGIAEYEMVHVLNLNNGERAETYAIVGRRGSGAIELNGPAARLGEIGDEVIVLSYGIFDEGEEACPLVVRLRAGNRAGPAKAGRR